MINLLIKKTTWKSSC